MTAFSLFLVDLLNRRVLGNLESFEGPSLSKGVVFFICHLLDLGQVVMNTGCPVYQRNTNILLIWGVLLSRRTLFIGSDHVSAIVELVSFLDEAL